MHFLIKKKMNYDDLKLKKKNKYTLLLSRFSHVQLCVTSWTVAHHALSSLGFSSQEHWGGLPLPSPMHDSESENEVA